MRRWPTEEQLERYYSRLERYAKPVRSELIHHGWKERIDQLRSQYGDVEDHKWFFENASKLLEADRAVGLPLAVVWSEIDRARTLNVPWREVLLLNKNCPILSLEQIYTCLCQLCDENLSMILHMFDALNYDCRLRFIDTLHKKRKRQFCKLIKDHLSTNDLVILSDICWNNKLTDAAKLGSSGNWRYELNRKGLIEHEEDRCVKTVEDFKTRLGAGWGFYYLCWGELHRPLFSEQHLTDREKIILTDIMSRPEAEIYEQNRISFEEQWEREHKSKATIDNQSSEEKQSETKDTTDDSAAEEFALPDSFFNLDSTFPIDQKNSTAHFIPDFDIQKKGGIKFAELINTISSYGYIAPSSRSKRLLTYVLTGRFKPEDYQEGEKVEWLDSGNGYELIYVIKYIIGNEKGKYQKVLNLFNGPQWLGNGEFKDQADYASTPFRRALNNIYPEECKLKGISAITKGTQEEPSEWSYIPPAPKTE